MCKMLRSTQSISPVCLCVALFVHGNLRCYKGKTSNAAPPWGQPVTALYNTTHLAPTTHTSAIHIRKRHAADNVHTQCLFIYMKVHPNSCELCKLPPSLEQHTHTHIHNIRRCPPTLQQQQEREPIRRRHKVTATRFLFILEIKGEPFFQREDGDVSSGLIWK